MAVSECIQFKRNSNSDRLKVSTTAHLIIINTFKILTFGLGRKQCTRIVCAKANKPRGKIGKEKRVASQKRKELARSYGTIGSVKCTYAINVLHRSLGSETDSSHMAFKPIVGNCTFVLTSFCVCPPQNGLNGFQYDGSAVGFR